MAGVVVTGASRQTEARAQQIASLSAQRRATPETNGTFSFVVEKP